MKIYRIDVLAFARDRQGHERVRLDDRQFKGIQNPQGHPRPHCEPAKNRTSRFGLDQFSIRTRRLKTAPLAVGNPYGVLKFQRDLSLLLSNSARVGVLSPTAVRTSRL